MDRLLTAFASFLIATLGLFVPTSSGADVLLTTSAPLPAPRKVSDRAGPADQVEFSIFIPDGVKVIRGAVMNPFHLKTAEQEHWREACRGWGFALIGSNHFGVHNNQYASTLQAALDDAAVKTGRPELKHIPLCFVGMSAGGGMSRSFAAAMPDRTIAVAPVCLEVAPDVPPLHPIPFLNVFGEKDGKQMPIHLEKLPVQRKAGANWGIAVQWGRKHEFALANNLVVPFFEDVIRQGLPAGADPSAGPVKLREVSQADAWLGDVSGWAEKKRGGTIAAAAHFKGDPSSAAWFPSARVAAAWRALVSADGSVTITEPAGLGDGQPFAPHDAGKPIKIIVVTKDKEAAAPSKIELFDGDKLLASKDAAPYEFEVKLDPGSHPLIAVSHGVGDARSFSRPHTIIVK